MRETLQEVIPQKQEQLLKLVRVTIHLNLRDDKGAKQCILSAEEGTWLKGRWGREGGEHHRWHAWSEGHALGGLCSRPK